jgi:hypothetical protein
LTGEDEVDTASRRWRWIGEPGGTWVDAAVTIYIASFVQEFETGARSIEEARRVSNSGEEGISWEGLKGAYG